MSLLKARLIDGKLHRFDGDKSLWSKQGIYRIVCLANGMTYYGSCSASKGMGMRFHQHVYAFRRATNRHPNPLLLRDWMRYGEGAFLFEVLEACEPSDCLKREQYYLDLFGVGEERNSYNLCPIAGNNLGSSLSSEARRKISESLKGNQRRKGIPHSEETRAKMSAAGRGKARPVSEAHRGAMSKAQKLRAQDPAIRLKNQQKACLRRYIATAPDGSEFQVSNLSAFCEQRGLKLSGLHRVATGKKPQYKGWTCRYADGLPIPNEPRGKRPIDVRLKTAKTYIATDPNGREMVVKGLNLFCEQNGLSPSSMTKVVRGEIKSHRGWTCRKLQESPKASTPA